MPGLWLKFKDENDVDRRVEVTRTPFTIGRHSECDLTILDGRLSREHVRIERREDEFIVSDSGSSNGTTLNGVRLSAPAEVTNEDRLDLGGVVIILEVEKDAPADIDEPHPLGTDPNAGMPTAMPAAQGTVLAGPGAAEPTGIPTAFFFIAPLMGILVLAVVVGAVILLGGGESEIASDQNDAEYTFEDDEPANNRKDKDDDPKPARPSTPALDDKPVNKGQVVDLPGNTEMPPPAGDPEQAKVEKNGAVFIRQIAQNDPKAFLTGEQAAKVNSKVKQLVRSQTLSDNLSSARKNASAIKTLAEQKNLKPQFLAAAAIAKLGGSRGDVLQAAQSVADVYDQLRIQIGNENFDDALLMVAAFDQGAAGETMKMRNMLQNIAAKSNEGARSIRSIWFLEKNGKISAAEFDRALSFLAIGTIAQNPADFGVKAEALKL